MNLKRFYDRIKRAIFNVESNVGVKYEDQTSPPMEGEVFFEVRDGETGEILEERHIKNVITRDMSILLAWLAWDSNGPTHSLLGLAVGTGTPTGSAADELGAGDAPPPATEDQRALFEEIERKAFLEKNFIDENGNVVSYPTHIVDFTTEFDVGEASSAPIVEMGLIGGDVDINNPDPLPNGSYDPALNVEGKDILCNYLTFKAINKPASAVLKISWRITF